MIDYKKIQQMVEGKHSSYDRVQNFINLYLIDYDIVLFSGFFHNKYFICPKKLVHFEKDMQIWIKKEEEVLPSLIFLLLNTKLKNSLTSLICYQEILKFINGCTSIFNRKLYVFS